MKEIIIIMLLLLVLAIYSESAIAIIMTGILFCIILKFTNSMTEETEEKRSEIINSFHVHKKKGKDLSAKNNVNNIIDKQQFHNIAKNIFLKYYIGINERNLETLKSITTAEFMNDQEKKFESKELQKNYNDFVQFEDIYIYSYDKECKKEKITVRIKYIEIRNEYNVATGEIIKGLSKKINKLEYVTFERYNHNESEKEIYSAKCPMCGAPTEIITTGKCQYCGKMIQAEDFGWKICEIRYSK